MAYYNGSANSLTALRTALVDTCLLEGWSWDSTAEVLSKGVMFLRVTVDASNIWLLGRTSSAAGDAPGWVRIGRVFSRSGYPTYEITFPASYEIFVFEQEVYMVVNYDVDRYQWCAFGKSTVGGLAGTGMWVGASLAATTVGTQGSSKTGPIYMFATGGGDAGNNAQVAPALCWGYNNAYNTAENWWLHSDLDGQGWFRSNDGSRYDWIGVGPAAPLISNLPNRWNDESVLLPIRAYKARPEYYLSLVGDFAHCRYVRIDNYDPGQVITIGDESWKVFPWFRKNASARNGGNQVDHTGTFGWAIRYEGP
ncbi:hypothetical protein [uncultured Halopseudomonas sp.]|mgnify:CR=1 FL=1|uniref:hypothetical protein n=1 Tax=uncultured Halopseudomonas sp. TaxID=2901193 RepID=UPI0030ED82A9|tara:strand:- start:21827 stop:22753 length:927 start_codon:yes stop_codon:yes gene_type:complete